MKDNDFTFYEVWAYDEYLDWFPTHQKAWEYILRLDYENVYLVKDLRIVKRNK